MPESMITAVQGLRLSSPYLHEDGDEELTEKSICATTPSHKTLLNGCQPWLCIVPGKAAECLYTAHPPSSRY